MPITLNNVSGTIDAAIVDDNFGELETLLKENVTNTDFTGRFSKYKIRRYTSGKISGFNSGSQLYESGRSTARSGTFENNWIAGTPAITYIDHLGIELPVRATEAGVNPAFYDFNLIKNDLEYNHPLLHPFELLGYPGGSLYYDFQEQGFADPVSYYSAVKGKTVLSWPPPGSPLSRFPADECWSRWLTVPDAAGGVYVDEPCVAIVTAQVQGNYFFTPALRVHGTNTSGDGGNASITAGDSTIDAFRYGSRWKLPSLLPGLTSAGVMTEGMQHSAHLRLGLFADTNPIVWDDEFFNGNDYGNVSLGSGHGFNPWIGVDPTGEYTATRPDNVSKTRSWIKLTDLTCRVRQRGSYKIIGIVQLKGRRRYNFSMKFRPAMAFGHVDGSDTNPIFKNGYWEIGDGAYLNPASNLHNTGWYWSGMSPSATGAGQTWKESYFYPGGDALVTNMIDSSALSVEFFYGQQISNLQEIAATFNPGWDPNF